MNLVSPGGLLQVHAVCNWYHKLQIHRRVNALRYLSDDWDASLGGALEFWDLESKQVVDRAYPHFNSLDVVVTGAGSLHGQPDPLACPEGKYRRALNFYYYRAASDPVEALSSHWTRYVTGTKADTDTVQGEDPYAVEASPFAAGLGQRFLG